MKLLTSLSLLLSLSLCQEATAWQQIFLPNGEYWDIIKVIDGDTLQVRIDSMPEGVNLFSIRLRGIDAPEIGPKARCAKERELALRAKQVTEKFLNAYPIILRNPRPDKYGSRILADITGDGHSLSGLLLSLSLALPYEGGKRPDWCNR